MNSVTMIGRLCQDVELRRTQNGTACCSFSLAVKRPRVKDTTDFHSCVVWQQGAEYLCQYGHKGDIVAVTGYLTTREWTDKDGNKRTTTEVTCDIVELLSSKRNSEAGGNTTQTQNGPQHFEGNFSQAAAMMSKMHNTRSDFPVMDNDSQLPF